MIASSTKAITESEAKEYAHDIELLAKNDYLSKVDVTLINSYGSEIRAIQYTFQTENASGSERPGGMCGLTPDGRVRIILSHTDKYRSESDKVSKLPFEITWVSTTESTNHSSLSAVGEH